MAPQIQPGPIGPRVARPATMLEQSGTINTSAGPLNWSRAVNGTFSANGNGQQLTITPTQGNDGSMQSKMVFSRLGQAPYLTAQSVMQASPNSVTITLTGGQSHLTLAQSHLTLTLNGFDASFSSANAMVSGSIPRPAVMARSAVRPSATSVTPSSGTTQTVNWTGRVDLTKNPLIGTPIPGWPRGAFASEITAAAFFGPLGKVLVNPTVTPPPSGSASGTHGGVIERSGWVTLGHVACWAAGGALGAGFSVGTSGAGAAWAAGLAGGMAAACSDLVDEYDTTDVPVDPPPNPDIPLDPEPTGPDTQTQPDDDSSGGGGGGSSTHKRDDDTDTPENLK